VIGCGGPGYRDHVGVSLEQPGQCHLKSGRVPASRHFLESLRKGRRTVARTGARTDGTAGKGSVGDQGHVHLAAGLEDTVGFGRTVQQAVLDLVGRERYPVAAQHVDRLPHARHVAVADPHGPDLPGLDRLGHGRHPGVHSAQGVGEVQVVEVERSPVEPLQRPVQRGAELGGDDPDGQRRELAGQHHRPAVLPGRHAHGPLGPAEAVDLRSVEEAHPHIDRRRQGLVQAGVARLAGTPPVGANPERRHTHARSAQRPLGCAHRFPHLPSAGRDAPAGREKRASALPRSI
jgi:hypothetical protein